MSVRKQARWQRRARKLHAAHMKHNRWLHARPTLKSVATGARNFTRRKGSEDK